MRSGNPEEDQPQMQQYLLCLAVGIKQKSQVSKIVGHFDLRNFAVVLFHYDGIVDQWSDLPWHDAVVHVRLCVRGFEHCSCGAEHATITGVCTSAEQVVVRMRSGNIAVTRAALF